MDNFGIDKVNGSEMNILNSKFSSKKEFQNSQEIESSVIENSNMTKPTIELDDFFAYLDPKVVEKIMQTPEKSRARIVQNVQQYEYDNNGAQNILNSLG